MGVEREVSSGVSLSNAMKMIGEVKVSITRVDHYTQQVWADEKVEEDALNKILHGEIGSIAVNPEVSLSDDQGLLAELEDKMMHMEKYIREANDFTSCRTQELRNRLSYIEDLVRSQ